MPNNIIEQMQQVTSESSKLFSKNTPTFTVAIPSKNKMSILFGIDSLKTFIKEQDPNTIDLGQRTFPKIKDGVVVDEEDIWCLEFDSKPVYILKNNKVMTRGQIIVALKQTGFAS